MAEVFCDISVWQGAIDWAAYAAWYRTTYPGATPKASMKATEGVGYTDPRYWDNEAGTRANGIQRIHYHWGRPDLSGPEEEADWCWRVIGPNFQPSDLVELDYEQEGFRGNYEAWKNRWLARMATYTSRYGMYSGQWFLGPRGITWGPGFVHAAVYGPTAPICDIWQFSSSGSFPGMNGLIDSNLLLTPAIFGDAPLEVDMWTDNDEKMLQAVNQNAALLPAISQTIQNGLLPLLSQIAELGAMKVELDATKTELDAIQRAINDSAGHPADAAVMAAVAKAQASVDAIGTKLAKVGGVLA